MVWTLETSVNVFFKERMDCSVSHLMEPAPPCLPVLYCAPPARVWCVREGMPSSLHRITGETLSAVPEILPSVAPNQPRAACMFTGSYSRLTPPTETHTDYTNTDTKASCSIIHTHFGHCSLC